LEIGNYGRRLQVEISASFPFINEDSLTFWIEYLWTPPGIASKKSTYRRNQWFEQEGRSKSTDGNIRPTNKYLILPHASAVPIILKFTSGLNDTYVERLFSLNRNSNYGCMPPGSLISRQHPQHHINNFSTTAVTIQVGQVLWTTHRLGRMEKYLTEDREQIFALGSSTWSPVEIQDPLLWLGVNLGPLSKPPAK
jgi:hypothetical protein